MLNEEIKKFNELAGHWWELDGPFRMLHRMNPVFVQYIRRFVDFSKSPTLIDVGCGGGILCEALASVGGQVTGVDPAPKSIAQAQQHYSDTQNSMEGHIDYFSGFLSEYIVQHNNKQFDAACCFEVLEHTDHPGDIIGEMASVVKPGGFLFFSTINRTIQSLVQAIGMAEYVMKIIDKGTHHHDQFIKPSELDAYCRNAHLEIQHISGIGYHPIDEYFYLKTNPSVNYICVYQKPL